MRDDGMESEQVKIVQRIVNIRRNREVRKFHQQIIFLIQCVLSFLDLNVLNSFVAQMEIASGGEFQPAFYFRLKFISELKYRFGKEFVFRVRVRSGNYMGNAVGDSDFRHLGGNFHGLCAVVYAGKNVEWISTIENKRYSN